jgi:hypothetical protein
MVPLGIECGRKGKYMGWAELNAEPASLASLYMDGNSATRHLVLMDPGR